MSLICKFYSRWQRDCQGATAIEFALVVMPFTLIVVAIIELAMVFTANSLLQGASQDAVRLIRTGQVQDIADPDAAQAFLRQAMCDHIPVALIDCQDIQFSVQTLDSFSSANTNIQYDEDGNLVQAEFDTGGAGDIFMMQVLYYHPLLTPLIGQFFADSAGNTKLMTATIVMETEPYDFEDDFI